MVPRENKHVIGIITLDKRYILIYCVCRAFEPFRARFSLIRRKYMYASVRTIQIPRFAVADIFVQYKRLVLRHYANRIDAGIYAIGKRKIDDSVFSAERHRRFCDFVGEREQPAALPSGKQHSHAFLFIYSHIPSVETISVSHYFFTRYKNDLSARVTITESFLPLLAIFCDS